MSVECSVCEMDLRSGPHLDCNEADCPAKRKKGQTMSETRSVPDDEKAEWGARAAWLRGRATQMSPTQRVYANHIADYMDKIAASPPQGEPVPDENPRQRRKTTRPNDERDESGAGG